MKTRITIDMMMEMNKILEKLDIKTEDQIDLLTKDMGIERDDLTLVENYSQIMEGLMWKLATLEIKDVTKKKTFNREVVMVELCRYMQNVCELKESELLLNIAKQFAYKATDKTLIMICEHLHGDAFEGNLMDYISDKIQREIERRDKEEIKKRRRQRENS